MTKNILVIGASAGIGLETVKSALAAGYAVTAFSRSAEKIAIDDAALTKINGDARERSDVEAALDRTDAVVQALGVPISPQMILGPVNLFSSATAVLLPAMTSVGVDRLISVTGFGAGDSKSQIPLWQRPGFFAALGRAYADKDIQERMIKSSALRWTIARPVVLTNGGSTGRYDILTEPREFSNGIVSRADVADFIVTHSLAGEYVWKAPVLRRSIFNAR